MRDLGIEFISVFGLPPVDFVHLAADLGCRYISTALSGRPLKSLKSLGYRPFSLTDDVQLRQRLRTAMHDCGVGTTIELAPGMTIGDPATVVAAIENVGRTNLRLAVDTMHWARSGYGAVELRELGPEKIGYVQLSDTTLEPRVQSYMEEAMYERMALGDGELPLAEILAAVPADVVIGLEIPMRGLAGSGVGPMDRLRPCVAAARELCNR
jgi:sugar phosphate isomerase/epimerase